MPLQHLERLVERKQLSRHQPTRREVENHLSIARAFRDAANLRGTPERVRLHSLYDAIEEGLREIEIRLKRLSWAAGLRLVIRRRGGAVE